MAYFGMFEKSAENNATLIRSGTIKSIRKDDLDKRIKEELKNIELDSHDIHHF